MSKGITTEIHGLTIVIRELYDTEVTKICDLLGVKRFRWTKKEYKDSVSYSYAFKGVKESIYYRLGSPQKNDHGKEVYYFSRLTLHGSFFDNSPRFDLDKFLATLSELSDWTPKQLDVAYMDTPRVVDGSDVLQPIISLDKWLEWCGPEYKKYLSGNILRKTTCRVVTTAGMFERIELGNASSATSYGTIYVRPNGVTRLEIKFRDSDQINYILCPDFPENAHTRRLNALTTQFSVCSYGTARTRAEELHPLFAQWFTTKPIKLNWKEIKAAQKKQRDESDRYKYEAGLKRTMGYFTNFVSRHTDHYGADKVLHDLAAALGDTKLETLLASLQKTEIKRDEQKDLKIKELQNRVDSLQLALRAYQERETAGLRF
ncbi:MAG: hypothetical protein FIA89_03540 [Geobacter sp.]|nr:hypothetical protein [Geobacter sp.]